MKLLFEPQLTYSTLRLYFSAQLYLWNFFLSIISIIDVLRAGMGGGRALSGS